MTTVNQIVEYIDSIAPFKNQEEWDNSGFLVGNGNDEVKKILVALDATESVISEAEETGANLIITHHPIIFNKLGQFHPSSLSFIAAQKNIAVICAHTCLDIADGGVNDCLAKALGLSDIKKCNDSLGLLRIGSLDRELSLGDFLSYVNNKLGIVGIKYTPTDKPIKNVAVCGGSGAEFYNEAFSSGADAFVTANIKHNYFLEFRRYGLCVLDAGHFCTENVVVDSLAERLKCKFTNIQVIVSKVSRDPADYWVK